MKQIDERINKFRAFVQELPETPGIYQFIDNKDSIIYVGKASNLKKRISSYFNRNQKNNKIRIMLSKTDNIKYIVVDNESEALLLENNFIKKYQPRYNVLLKDDKSFPWICIKNEKFPRVFSTRNFIKDGSLYFGPYTSARFVRMLIELFKQLYKIRTCNYKLDNQSIGLKKYKVCLEYHIGNCRAPCVSKQTEEDYSNSIAEIKSVLKGNVRNLIRDLRLKMDKLASSYNYEQAELVKEKIDVLEKYMNKSTIVNPSIDNVDVYSYTDDVDYAYINFIKVIKGAVIQSHTIELKKKLDESKEELLLLALAEIRRSKKSKSPEIIIPFKLDIDLQGVKILVPLKGDKKKLLDLSTRNAFYFKIEKMKQREKANPAKSIERILNTLKIDLKLLSIPKHIECFDISNIQGNYPVASCVVFRNAKPSKKEYRHFNIKTVTGPDDFASMKEVISRRYRRILDEKKSLPQLIIVDGGKGQLNSAVDSLKEIGIYQQVSIIGIAKRLEEIFFPGDSIPLYIDKNSESLKLVQNLRNEAHRFGIAFHRLKRSKEFIKSELEKIPGIGPKTIEILLKELKSVEKIKTAGKSQLIEIINPAKAEIIFNYFNNI